jgi:hypothetical protein
MFSCVLVTYLVAQNGSEHKHCSLPEVVYASSLLTYRGESGALDCQLC